MRYEFLIESYDTERVKVLSVWSEFRDDDLPVRPRRDDPRGRSVHEHMVHQCVSENNWFRNMLGIDVGAPPLPEHEDRLGFIARYAEDSGLRLERLRATDEEWWEATAAFFDVRRTRAWIMTRRLTHTSHHRGQQMAMLRMLGRSLHSNYGPTADTGGLMQSRAPTIYAYSSVDALLEGERLGGAKSALPQRAGEGIALTERPDSTEPDVRIGADARDLSERAAAASVETIAEAVRRHGRCSIVLSGGNTPRELYRLLASTYRDQVQWARVHVFWGDERFVSLDDPASNYRMARESLLDHVPLSDPNIHPMPTQSVSPDAAAGDYERTLRAEAGGHRPLFDLVLLGLGEDGHTASLFPRSPALHETTRLVVAVTAPVEPLTRLTLTLRAIASAARIFVLASGASKASALEQALSPGADPNTCPAAGLLSAGRRVTWWVDRNAAAPSRS